MLICAGAWVLAAVAELVFIVRLPAGRIVLSGVDLSHAAHMLHLRDALFIGCGLALALAAWLLRRWQASLVMVASLFYLSHWFPWHQVEHFGPLATARSMYLIGSTPGLRFISLIRDVVLPICFATAIVMAIFGTRAARSRAVPGGQAAET